jgi:membrane-bound lytic murein transglycosylase D
MAAYNCGVACVKRALRRSSGSTFWEAYGSLPRETRGYIPMFVATAQIFVSRDMQEEGGYAFGEVTVEGPLRLQTVSREGGVSLRKLEKLNLELRKGRVPPEPYRLKVPLKISGKLVRGSTRNSATRTYTVQKGDALAEIARRYDSTVRAFMEANQLQNTTVHPGQRLKIPGSDSELRIASSDVRRVDYGRSDPVVTSTISLADDQEEGSVQVRIHLPPRRVSNVEPLLRNGARRLRQIPMSGRLMLFGRANRCGRSVVNTTSRFPKSPGRTD